MKIKSFYFVSVILVFVFLSCEELSTWPSHSEQLYGAWISDTTENDIYVMKKSAGLDSNNYGFIFYSNGHFLNRSNAGWCGTPPISYKNYDGKWKARSDSMIHINVGYWGGDLEYNMIIVYLDDLIFKFRFDFSGTALDKRRHDLPTNNYTTQYFIH